MRLARKALSIVLMIFMLLGNLVIPVNLAIAASSADEVIINQIYGDGYNATDITLAPGKNATELNFAWYSNVVTTGSAIQIAKEADMTGTEFPADKATSFAGTTSSAITGFFSNKVTVTGLQESTEYVYRVGDGDISWSPVYNFTTQDTDSYSFLAIGDAQIGSSGSVASDTDGWKNTMSKALNQFGDVSFLLSLGDQVESNSNETEYSGFFAPPELRSLPVAPLVGNHDNGAANYNYHFNLPNLSSQYGITTNTSSDYYFTYGDTLIMVLNSNNTSATQHGAFIHEAIDANPNATWKVAMFHHDIYGSGGHAAETGIKNLRQALFPIFDQYDVDLVLTGHDHSYTRTYQMYNDQPIPGQNSIGTVYMTLNSGSGSKYYDLQATPETYAAVREQIKVPTFSKFDVTANTLTISTYRTDTMAKTDTYTISKEAQEALDLAEVITTADGDTLTTENPSGSIALGVTAKNSAGAAVDLSRAHVLYKTAEPDILSIATDGKVTVKNAPAMNKTVKVWAEVYDGSKFVKSNELNVNVTVPLGLAQVTLAANGTSISSNSTTGIKLSLTGKDTTGSDMSLSSATVDYKTDKANILAIAADGTVTVQNAPERNTNIKITAEVTVDGKKVTSNALSITVTIGAGTEIIVPVKNALDDIEERANGTLDFDSTDLEIVREKPADSASQLIGIRFVDLAIPQGATITDAYIQFSVDEVNKDINPFNVHIYAENVVDSDPFIEDGQDPTLATNVVSDKYVDKIAESVEWKDAPSWTIEHEAGTAEQTPNLAPLVQTIVSKTGWSSGNAISFMLNGEGRRIAESFDGSGNDSEKPTLHVNYVEVDSSIPISTARAQATGTTATVTGIVTCVNPTTGGSYFIQDGSAGICAYNTSLSPAPQLGDKIQVTGEISSYKGLLEIMPGSSADVVIKNSGNSIPEPRVVTLATYKNFQSQLVKIKNVTLGTINVGGNTTVTDDSGSSVIYKTPALTGISAGDKVDIITISAFYNSPQLIVPSAADIVKSAGSVDLNFASAATNVDGTQIEVKFSKAMADPTGKEAQFTVNDGASNPVTSAALKSGDATVIVLTLTNVIRYDQTATVAYQTGDLAAADGEILDSFTAQPVTNNGVDPSVSNVEILATSDIHGNIYPYDYFTGNTVSQGLAKVSTYVNQERQSNPNLMLIDNGDTIQGTPLATYYATIDKTSPNPMLKAMAAMNYDTWTLGNHEFNFGLDMLDKVTNEAEAGDIHVLSANTYKEDNSNLVEPYYIKTINTGNGDIKVGILGLTTKCIPNWENSTNYEGLHFNDLVTEAQKWVPIMRAAGADVIVASIHSGEEGASDVIPENQIKAVAQGVNGIDAIVAGHTHALIPQHTFTNPAGNTVIVTEPGKWGQYVSKLQFALQKQDGKWAVVNSSSQAVSMDSSIAADSTITSLAQPNQDATLAYLGTKIGTATDAYSGADQLTTETAIMDLINKVQQQESGAQLSIAAPLSSGAMIPKGDVTIKDISSVYIYENFLYSIDMTGAQLKKWMEHSVRYYKQVSSPSAPTTKDTVLNIPDYNLDQLYGANYTINLTQPAGSRIKDLTYNGNPILDTDVFTVAINNYRYNGGGGFMAAAGLTPGQGAIYDSMKTLGDAGQVRNLLIEYIQEQQTITPTVDNYWSISKELTNGDKIFDIVEITDLHGNIGNDTNSQIAAVLAENMKKVKADNPNRTLILANGDNYQGTSISNLQYGEPVMEIFNYMGVAVSALGNHEFDWGLDKVTDISHPITAQYPIICANLFPKGNTTTPVFDPYKIFTLDGVKIAVVGGITESTPNIVAAGYIEDYDVLSNVTYINKYTQEAKAAGAQIVIALIHEGDDYSNGATGPIVNIAKNLVDVDAVLGGHTHDIVSTTVITNSGKSIPLAIGNSNGKGYIDLKAILHEDGSLTFTNANAAYVAQDTTSTVYPYGYKATTPTVDQNVKQIIADTMTEEGPTLSEVLGSAQKNMTRTQAVSPYGESLAGNWATDVMRSESNADFAFQNNGGLRSDILQGEIAMYEIYNFMPFDNVIMTCDMTGAQLKVILEQAVADGGYGIQLSGMKLGYDSSKPSGSRVHSIAKSDGTLVNLNDTTTTYRVATNDFLAGGTTAVPKDGFSFASQSANMTDTHILVRDALADAVRDAGTTGITASIENRINNQAAAVKPAVKIAVISDTHYFAPELGTTGSAFEQYLAGDRKMIAESKAILESTIAALKNSAAEIVLVTGDLTKDGELLSHQQFAGYLQELEDAGKKVYVIAGNHDINNPNAASYSGDQVTPVAYVTPSEFKTIYQNFGFAEAITFDPNSLSYAVDPIPGLRIIAMDSALYDTNLADNYPKTAGAFSADRQTWINAQIADGVAKGKTVIGMMHHGVTNHFSLESGLFPEYVINNADQVASDLSSNGMKVVFTGHFHAQDITKKTLTNNQFLFDVETGSLVTSPVPYRLVELTTDGKLSITTNRITDIDFNTGGKDFQTYARDFLELGLIDLVPQMLASIIMQMQPGLTPAQAMEAANNAAAQQLTATLTVKDCLVNAMVAHYQGDEVTDSQLLPIYQGMTASTDALTKTLGGALLSLNSDLLPADNRVILDLNNGNVEQPVHQQLSIEFEKQIVEVGGEATATISTESAENFYGFDLSLKYDPQLFEYVSITTQDKFNLGEAGVAHDANGNIHIVGVLKGESTGIDGDSDLVTVKLKAKDKDALSTLKVLASSAFSDGNLEVCTLDNDVVKKIAVANSDVTKNSELQINDLVMVAKLFGAEQSVVGSGYETAIDMNKDGIIDIEDIAYVAKMLVGR